MSALRTKRCNAAQWLGLATAAVLLSATFGCAHGRKPVLPTGVWEGRGTVYYEGWPEHDETGRYDPNAAVHTHRDYPTRLELRPVEVGGATLTRMEIVSESGQLAEDDDGDGTHLICYLEPTRQNDAVTTYALAGKALTRDLSEQLADEPPTADELGLEPPVATCQLYGPGQLLQIKYTDGFTEIFTFMGDNCYKLGGYQPDGMDGLVHWQEILRRKH